MHLADVFCQDVLGEGPAAPGANDEGSKGLTVSNCANLGLIPQIQDPTLKES